jgi:hypothetical protein
MVRTTQAPKDSAKSHMPPERMFTTVLQPMCFAHADDAMQIAAPSQSQRATRLVLNRIVGIKMFVLLNV